MPHIKWIRWTGYILAKCSCALLDAYWAQNVRDLTSVPLTWERMMAYLESRKSFHIIICILTLSLIYSLLISVFDSSSPTVERAAYHWGRLIVYKKSDLPYLDCIEKLIILSCQIHPILYSWSCGLIWAKRLQLYASFSFSCTPKRVTYMHILFLRASHIEEGSHHIFDKDFQLTEFD